MNAFELSRGCAEALSAKDWSKLESLSVELLTSLDLDPRSIETDIRKVARYYLASIIGDGKFLKSSDAVGFENFRTGLAALRKVIDSSKRDLITTLRPEIQHIRQIQLFMTKPQADTLNKVAKSLRRIGRPHLAIDLATAEIQKSRLNYYSLVVRCSAYVDLKMFDAAIQDGELALKHSPGETRRFALTLLARAKKDQFRFSGLLDDGELALSYALQSLEIKRDAHTARVFISIVNALGISDYDELIDELNASMLFDFDQVDPVATQISVSIVDQTQIEESIEEDDPWGIESDEDDFADEWSTSSFDEEDSISDYFGDYFEEFSDSLNDPQSPHLEP
jgi:tetratricopeptide (TPR) repeat protein